MSIYKAQQPGLASFANPRTEEPSLFDLIFEFAARSKQLSIEDTETGRRRCTVVFGHDTSDEDRSRLVAGLEAKGYSVEHSVQFPPREIGRAHV